MDTVRVYMEFDGTLVPEVNRRGHPRGDRGIQRHQGHEENGDGFDPYEEPYDEHV